MKVTFINAFEGLSKPSLFHVLNFNKTHGNIYPFPNLKRATALPHSEIKATLTIAAQNFSSKSFFKVKVNRAVINC